VRPGTTIGDAAADMLGTELAREHTLMDLLRRPDVRYGALMRLPDIGPGVDDPAIAEQLEIQARYAGYIDRQHDEIERHRRHEETALPADMDYERVRGLSNEVRQKLTQTRPETIGQAARIPGMTPAAISLLLVHLKKRSGTSRKIA
jgi:tRNA uridine 5-carboxymethylaminomethyl modification enzyme